MDVNEEQGNVDYENENGNNSSANGNFKLKGAKGLAYGLKKGLKGIGKNLKVVFNSGIKKLLTTKLFVPILITSIVVIAIACIIYVINNEAERKVTDSVSSYFSSSLSDASAKEMFDETGSLILATNEDIKNISDAYLEEIKEQYKTLYEAVYKEGYVGSHEISEISYANGFNIMNAYEFILNSERMNFNRIDWKSVSRDGLTLADITDFEIDEKTNLRYPNVDDEQKDLDYYVKLVRPYLQSYIIPSSMASGITSISSEDMVGNFAYQIIDKGYHKIQVNQYTLQNVTKHQTVRHYVAAEVNVTKYSWTERVVDTYNEETGETTYKTVTYYGYNSDQLNDKLKTVRESTYKEAYASDNDTKDYSVPLNSNYSAEVFDKDIIFAPVNVEALKKILTIKYNQNLYNEDDVANFENPEAKAIVDTEDYQHITNVESGLSGYTRRELAAKGAHTTGSNIVVTANVGQDVTTKYYWQDELEVEDSQTRYYNLEDITSYVNFDFTDEGEERESIQNVSLSPDDQGYYNDLALNEDITRIDLINSHPDVYSDYLEEGEEYSENIGFSRVKIRDAFNMMDKYLKDLLGDKELTLDYEKVLNESTLRSLSILYSSLSGVGFGWPLDPTSGATITSCAGYRNIEISVGNHSAMDIGVASGTFIFAAQDGVVEVSSYDSSYGNWVCIKHTNNADATCYTVYAHMRESSKLKKR